MNFKLCNWAYDEKVKSFLSKHGYASTKTILNTPAAISAIVTQALEDNIIIAFCNDTIFLDVKMFSYR